MRANFILISFLLFSSFANAAGNDVVNSYNDAKRLLYGVVYADHRVTLYCGARYDRDRNVELPLGFVILAHEDRAYRAETEHIVAAENFGRAFQEWRVGAPQCVDGRSAVEWIMESYRVKTDKDSGIVNDPNLWAEEHGKSSYILDLLLSVMTVSLKTLDIVDGLPRLNFDE